MSQKLDELNARLDALKAALPRLIAEHPTPADFWEAFAGEADAIEDDAGKHAHVVNERIDAMLAMHGRYIASVDPRVYWPTGKRVVCRLVPEPAGA